MVDTTVVRRAVLLADDWGTAKELRTAVRRVLVLAATTVLSTAEWKEILMAVLRAAAMGPQWVAQSAE